uniref:Uncharacterized protein n=1 Tax=Anguilla anguilla TaxID=7936 RepID=A0A0E9WID3_ANGAN
MGQMQRINYPTGFNKSISYLMCWSTYSLLQYYNNSLTFSIPYEIRVFISF